MRLDYEGILDRIFESKFGRRWIRDRERDLRDEIEFYGRELSEKEWRSNLLSNFFEQDLPEIVEVLPEIWEEVQEEVRSRVESGPLHSVKDFEGYIESGSWRDHVVVLFSLPSYLGDLESDLHKVLEKRFQWEEGA
jgi:hypothetical protein